MTIAVIITMDAKCKATDFFDTAKIILESLGFEELKENSGAFLNYKQTSSTIASDTKKQLQIPLSKLSTNDQSKIKIYAGIVS